MGIQVGQKKMGTRMMEQRNGEIMINGTVMEGQKWGLPGFS